MRRAPLCVSVLAVVLLGLVSLGRTGPSAAQDATPPAAGQGFVGSWRVVVNDVSGLTYPALFTFAADGTMTFSAPPIFQAPPGAPFALLHLSGGHGAWARSDGGTAAIAFDVLGSDENGNAVGSFTVRSSVELSTDGQSFEGAFDMVLTDPGGNALPVGAGTLSGTRIVVEVMGQPVAATPVA